MKRKILILARYLLLTVLGFGLSSVISLAANENGSYADDGKKAWQQEIEVSGTVADAQTGEPLPGVNIVVEGTTVGTSTDMDGNYTLEAPSDATLVFSFVGYQEVTVNIEGRQQIDVEMKQAVTELEEVVAVGYGTTVKSDLTGSISNVSQDELVDYPSTNAIQSLQGRSPGVMVKSTNGEPGGAFTIRIRGTSSVNASGDPLIVVDGMVGGVMPPPEDIASIDILKDASATAIYGSRGSNGVVMISTKSGEAGETKVEINSSYSFDQEIGRLDLLNARQFSKFVNDARGYEFYDLEEDTKVNTDWQELIYRPGHTQKHQVAVSGGSDKIQYYLSGIYFDQKGVIQTSRFDRYSFTNKLIFNVSDNIRINWNSTVQRLHESGILSQTGGGVRNAGAVTAAYRMDPNVGVMDENGNYNKSKVGIAAFENPMAVIDGREEESRLNNIETKLKAEFDITKGLVFNSFFGMGIRNRRYGTYANQISETGDMNNGLGQMNYRKNFNFLTEQYLNYDFDIGEKNDFVFTGGYSYEESNWEALSATNTNFVTDAMGFWNLGAGTNPEPPSSNYSKSNIVSFYGRVNYIYDNRYLLTLNSRYDGASQFSKENKWSFFPSAAFSWNISNEEFWLENNILSTLKFRTSYGLAGNQAISPYQSLARLTNTFFVRNESSVNSVRPNKMANKDLTWETTTEFNVGLDFSLFENRISINTDYYNKKTDDLLFTVPIAWYSGFNNRLKNFGQIENKGFEFQITSKNLVDQFKWTTSFNLSLNRNKVLSLPNDGADVIYSNSPTFVGSRDNTILREGESLGSFYGYVYEGVYQEGDEFIPGGGFETEPGGEKFADINNDGVLNSDDRKIIGNPNPNAVWGLNNDFSYRGFDLNIFIQAFTGQDIMNLMNWHLDRLSGNTNSTTAALERWTPENTDTDVPAARAGRVSRVSNRFVEDGSFIRLKNISIGYDLSSNFFRNSNINSARIYLSSQNLLTVTNYSGVDPEVGFRESNSVKGLDFGSYPKTIAYTIGINFTF